MIFLTMQIWNALPLIDLTLIYTPNAIQITEIEMNLGCRQRPLEHQ